MNWNEYIYPKDEKPLDNIVKGYSRTSIFRKIAFIGDSLSSGEFQIKDANGTSYYYDFFEYSWGQYIARKNGITGFNFSRGGMTAKEYIESFGEKSGFFNPERACQAYVIALGYNDIYNAKMEIGSVKDVDVTDYRNNAKTFAGYYGALVSKYKEIAPEAKFFFVTLTNSDQYKNREEDTARMAELMNELTEVFDNSYVIDLYKYAPYYGNEFRKRFFLNGHMTPEGYIFTAEMIDSYIDYIIRHNAEDFKFTGFINTNIPH